MRPKKRSTMIPSWSQPALHVGHFTLFAHGILLLFGTLVSSVIFLFRAHTLSLPMRAAVRLILLLVPIGFLGSHLMYCVFDDPSALFELQGISSLGGILAALLAFALYTIWDRERRWRWLDAAAYAAVPGALIARLGCFLAHDRIGVPTSSWLSVNCFDGRRYDLALLEGIFLAIWLGVLTWVERHRWRPSDGMLFAVLAVSYGILRLILGELREVPQRYFGLTSEQWPAVILLVVGACCWLIIQQPARPPVPRVPLTGGSR
jgi:phosphatidylglycerol:prolipoprotein diacylglycerol transferase